MKLGLVCNRSVAVITKDRPVLEAARRMRDEHVGDLVVVELRRGLRVPVGVLTDRDVVVGLLARDADHLSQLNVGDVITAEVITAAENEEVREALERMCRQGIRRLPVVDDQGALVGIFTLDDLLVLLAEDLAATASVVASERRRELSTRP